MWFFRRGAARSQSKVAWDWSRVWTVATGLNWLKYLIDILYLHVQPTNHYQNIFSFSFIYKVFWRLVREAWFSLKYLILLASNCPFSDSNLSLRYILQLVTKYSYVEIWKCALNLTISSDNWRRTLITFLKGLAADWVSDWLTCLVLMLGIMD